MSRNLKNWPKVPDISPEFRDFADSLTRGLEEEFGAVFVETDSLRAYSRPSVTIAAGNTAVTVSNAITFAHLTTITDRVLVTPLGPGFSTYVVTPNYTSGNFVVSLSGALGSNAVFDWLILPTQYV